MNTRVVTTAAAVFSGMFMSFAAFAAPAPLATAPTPVIEAKQDPKIAEFKAIISNRLRVGLSVNTASKLDGLALNEGGVKVASGEANTENTPALELTWVSRLYEGPETTKFDWFVGMTLERERKISSLNLKAAGSAQPTQTVLIDTSNRPTFHANLLSAGVRWTPNALVYVPVGFTYGFRSDANGGSDTNFNLDPHLGLLAGAGLRLGPNFEMEAVYKIVRYDLTIRPAVSTPGGQEFVGSTDLAGLSVGARYIF